MKAIFHKLITVLVISLFLSTFLFSCTEKTSSNSIAVFVPGIVSGSPVYEMLVAGVEKAVTEFNVTATENLTASVSIIEAGTNQAEWGNKLTAVAASGQYNVIISSNPSLPELAAPLTEQFPNIKFIILDAFFEGNNNIATIQYNQREQAYMAGVAAGLVTTASKDQMKYSNIEKKIALIAAQEYPVMNNIILPAFAEGAKSIDPSISVEFRVVGNWYDASKASELAKSLYKDGVDVILPIAGGATQGVIAAAKELGFYITWFDDNGFSKAPGYVVSSTILKQEQMAFEVTTAYLHNDIAFGTASTVGIKDGYVEFVENDPLYLTTVDTSITNNLHKIYSEILTGELQLPTNK